MPEIDTNTVNHLEGTTSNALAELRPRGLWDILDDAFDLYRQRFTLFAGIAAALYVPAYAVFIAVTTNNLLHVERISRRPTVDPFAVLAPLFGGFVYTLPLLAVAYILQNGATAAAVESCLLGQPVTIWSAARRALRRLLPLLFSALIVGLLEMGGFFALLLPALLVAALYAFVAQIVVLERKWTFGAMRRSRELCTNGFGSSLALLLIVGLITGLISNGLSALLEFGWSLVPGVSDVAAQRAQQFIFNQTALSIVSLLLAPILGIATTLLYFDLRVRREGLDLIAQAQVIGYPLAPDPFGGAVHPRPNR